MSIQFIAKIDRDGTQKAFYLLNLLDISDSVSPALAQHEYANTDGAFIQNLGNHPRTVSFKTFWFGTAPDISATEVAPTFENHYLFLDDMNNSANFHTFVHPKYGTLKGYVTGIKTLHNETQDYVEIDVNFVEKDILNSSFIPTQPFDTLPDQVKATNNLLTTMNNLIANSGFADVLGKTVDFTKKLQAQITNVSQASRAFLGQLDTVLNVWDTFLATVQQPFSIVDATVNYVGDIPSRIVGSANGALRRAVASMANLNALPVQVTKNLIQYTELLGQTITSPTTTNTMLNIALGNCGVIDISGAVQDMLINDDSNDKANQQVEKRKVFDISGLRALVLDPVAVMSLQELEDTLYTLNAYIQGIVVLNRENALDVQDLLTLASKTTTYVDSIKLNRKSIVNVTINNIPLQLLITQMGLDYNAVDRVLKLNPQINNPTFSEGVVKVYAQ